MFAEVHSFLFIKITPAKVRCAQAKTSRPCPGNIPKYWFHHVLSECPSAQLIHHDRDGLRWLKWTAAPCSNFVYRHSLHIPCNMKRGCFSPIKRSRWIPTAWMFWEWWCKNPTHRFGLLCSVWAQPPPQTLGEISPLSLLCFIPRDRPNWVVRGQALPRRANILLRSLTFQKGSWNDEMVSLHCPHIYHRWIFMKCPHQGCLPVLNPDKRKVSLFCFRGLSVNCFF